MAIRTHTCGKLRINDKGNPCILIGWVDTIRDHGKVIFINLRDRYGITQIVVKNENLIKMVKKIGHEWVMQVKGKVAEREQGMKNSLLETGEIECIAEDIEIISKSKVPPFVIEDEVRAKDELRLKYRYLDLRRRPMQEALILKGKVVQSIRKYLEDLDFIEIETPILGKSTPEGARDFLVPSRLQQGKFYSLTQSPQIYKQLLMVAGFDRYYQFARCLRDEDQRSDRQPEHTQIDIEMSFVDEEQIFEIVEGLVKFIFKNTLNQNVKIPFRRMPRSEAMSKFGTDKPDMRYNFFIEDITSILKESKFNIFRQAECIKALPYTQDLSRKEIDGLSKIVEDYPLANGLGLTYLKFKDGKWQGPIVKFLNDKHFSVLNSKLLTPNSKLLTILLVAGKSKPASEALGAVRKELLTSHFSLPTSHFSFVWIYDFPLFEYNQETDSYEPCHHIFTMPKIVDGQQLTVNSKGRLYDLVLNGVELGSGSIRIHKRELQEKVMDIAGVNKEPFKCLLDALDYGAPPHGGIAIGLDRLILTMLGKTNLQDVIAFPKTITGTGLLENIPAEVTEQQLKEAHIKTV